MYIVPSGYQNGVVVFEFDLFLEPKAEAWIDFRETPTRKTGALGPEITLSGKGRAFNRQGEELARFGVEDWLGVRFETPLDGRGPTALTLSPRGAAPIRLDLEHQTADFRRLGWVGVTGAANETAAFFLDNLKLRIEK
ncbi:MAG: hypothetical protein BWZ10_01913 [candidate division BRC1 bacterium ADurb.BinA364]|nr:MAG: hypothetical protein BWZ10_01913 [candidate division BRC1 bacterium ADurb.BinA364]